MLPRSPRHQSRAERAVAGEAGRIQARGTESLAEKDAEIVSLHRHIEQYVATVARLEGELSDFLVELPLIQEGQAEQLALKDAEIALLGQQVAQHVATITQINRELNELSLEAGRIRSRETECLSERDAEITSLRQEMEQREAMLAMLDRQLNEISVASAVEREADMRRLAETEAEISALQRQIKRRNGKDTVERDVSCRLHHELDRLNAVYDSSRSVEAHLVLHFFGDAMRLLEGGIRTAPKPALSRFEIDPLAVDFGKEEVPALHAFVPGAAVILVVGQSNAANEGSGRYPAGPGVFNWNLVDGKCYRAADPLLGASGTEGAAPIARLLAGW